MKHAKDTRLEDVLDLLADAVATRLESRRAPAGSGAAPPAAEADSLPPELPAALAAPGESPPAVTSVAPFVACDEQAVAVATPAPEAEMEAPDATSAIEDGRSHAARLMARLALGLLALVVLINVPLNAEGMALARSIPSSAALVIRDGLLVQEAGSPDVWVYRDDAFHWITSLDAFDRYGYRWENVRSVEAGFLARFAQGSPVSLLLKCDASPHVYALEGGKKRWILDIPTFRAEGYDWSNVKYVDCAYLRGLPAGESIPPGHGTPPPPLP